MNKSYFCSERVRLRAMEPEDLEVMYAMENDSQTWDVTNFTVPYSRFVLTALHGRITQLFGAHIAGDVSDIFSVDLDGAAAYRLGTPFQRQGHQHIMLLSAPFEQSYIPFFLFYHKSFKLKMPDFGRALKFVCDYCSSPPVSLSFWNVKFFCTTCPMLSSI